VAIAVGKTLIPDTFGITLARITVHYTRKGELQVSKYRVTIELDERWFTILSELSKNTEGFVWVEVDKSE
jgi:hypothetical protein